MEWYSELYFGEKASENKGKLLKKILDGKAHPKIYLITLPSNEQNLLDIYPQPVLLQPHFKRISLAVIGIAIGKTEAQKLAGDIIMAVYRTTGKTDLKSFLGDNYTKEPDFLNPESYEEW